MLAPRGLASCSTVLPYSDAVNSACVQTEMDLKKGMDRAEVKGRRSEIAAIRPALRIIPADSLFAAQDWIGQAGFQADVGGQRRWARSSRSGDLAPALHRLSLCSQRPRKQQARLTKANETPRISSSLKVTELYMDNYST